MRKLISLLTAITLAGCTVAGEDDGGGNSYSCRDGDQKRFVRDAMADWYLWNDRLPNKVSIQDYASPEELLADLVTYSPLDSSGNPIDDFSYIGSAEADAQFFGAGRFEGFGFSRKIVSADEVRILQVFAGSPADLGGLARGQRILELDGRTVASIQAAEGIDTALSASPLTFLLEEPDGAQFTTTIAHDIVTIDPVPQWRVIAASDGSGRMVGYVELTTFVSTADAQLDTVFAEFRASGVNDVIVDLRYNGGGLVSTANLLGDYLGGDVAENLLFTETRFNTDRAARYNTQSFFDRLANSVSLSRLVVIATAATASASELVTNGLAPHVEVTIVGDRTFGKPVGQVGFEFCAKILRATAFQNFNADGFGDYFDGLPVQCAAADDLGIAVGADTDPNLITAMAYLDNGACPVAAAPAVGVSKVRATQQASQPGRSAPPWQEFAGAF